MSYVRQKIRDFSDLAIKQVNDNFQYIWLKLSGNLDTMDFKDGSITRNKLSDAVGRHVDIIPVVASDLEEFRVTYDEAKAQFDSSIEALNTNIEGINSTIEESVNQDEFNQYKEQTNTLINTKLDKTVFDTNKTATDNLIATKVSDEAFNQYKSDANILIETKLSNGTFESYQLATDQAIASKVSNGDFDSYRVQTADLIASKVEGEDFDSYKTQTANAIASKVSSGEFDTYKTQTATEIASKVGNNTFSSYQTQTNNAIASKVEGSEFNSYKTQTDSAIASKVGNTEYESYKLQTSNQIASKVASADFNSYKTQTDNAIASKVESTDFSSYQTQTNNAIASKVSQSIYDTDKTQIDGAIASKMRVFTTTPTPPYALGDIWITGTILRRCSTAKASGGVYALGDWTQVNNRVFTTTPVTPYIVGDLWMQGDVATSEIMRCNVARASGTYTASDWVKASNYGTKIASVESTVTQQADLIASKVASDDFQSYKTQTDSAISSKVASADFNSYKTQTDSAISQRVMKDGIVSSINQTAEQITIQANKIGLLGETNIPNLNANKITAGTLASERIGAGSITADKLDIRAKSLVNNFSKTGVTTGWGSHHGILGTIGGLGSYGIGLTTTNTGNNQIVSDWFEVDSNLTYKFSINIYCESSVGARYFGLYAYDRNGVQITTQPFIVPTKSWGVSGLNHYFWNQSGALSGSFNGWAPIALEGYALAHSVSDASEIPKGKNVSAHLKMLPNTKFLQVRYLNWDNGTTATTIVAHAPTVVPVDTGVITADRIEVTDSIGIGGKGATRANLTASKVQYFHNNTFSGEIRAEDIGGAKLMNMHGDTVVGMQARSNPLYANTRGASITLSHFDTFPEMATFDLRLKNTNNSALFQFYANAQSQFFSFGASDWSEDLIIDTSPLYGSSSKSLCLRPSKPGQWGLVGTSSYPWWRGHAGQWVNVSKRSGKCEIEDCGCSDGIEFIKSLEIKKYYAKRDIDLQKENPEHVPRLEYGLIADDAPEQVVDEDRGGILLYPFATLTAKAVQEIIKENECLENRVTTLEDKVATLESEIQLIKEMLNK